MMVSFNYLLTILTIKSVSFFRFKKYLHFNEIVLLASDVELHKTIQYKSFYWDNLNRAPRWDHWSITSFRPLSTSAFKEQDRLVLNFA